MLSQEIHAVTGVFGFSGSYIAERLLAKGHKVITFTNSQKREAKLQGKIEAFPFNFDNIRALTQSLEGVEVFYNTYWVRFNHSRFTHADAVKNTLTLFKAAKNAGVKRFVHVSISNANASSALEYFQGKGLLEEALKDSGMSYAILQPAVLFGDEGILINNIAWALRKLPVFPCFGDGNYHIQPIYVDDLASLAVEQGACHENVVLPAVGIEDFTYRELVSVIGKAIKCEKPVISAPANLGYFVSKIIGKLMGDVFVSKEEIEGLMADLLHIPQATQHAPTVLSEWIEQHSEMLGKSYANELSRRIHTTKAY